MSDNLTVKEACAVLNLGEAYVSYLIQVGELIVYRDHTEARYLRRDEVLAYKEAMRVKAEAILAELASESQALGLYDIPSAVSG